MSRSGYSDDCDNLAMWRGQVASATRGKRGQAFFRELLAALDALPEKRLIRDEINEGCEVCALGAVALKRGLALDAIDTHDYDGLGKTFNIAHQLAQEVMYENDEGAGSWKETPEERWSRVRAWAVQQIQVTPDELIDAVDLPDQL